MMFYTGVVEDRVNDPLMLGRCRVRVFGLHSPDKIELPTADLPWASLMQPVNSAAMSGIGFSPTGLVEGAVVIVMFLDEYQQQPVIIGSIAGIPIKPKDVEIEIVTTTESSVWKTGEESVLLSSKKGSEDDTPPVKSGNASAPKPSEPKKSAEIKTPTNSLVPSEECFAKIKREEGFASTVENGRKIVSGSSFDAIPNNATIYPYKDTKGIWTIGYGNTFLSNNTKVNADTRLTKAECVALMNEKINKEFGPGVRRALRTPVTQSMFDTLVSMAYNSGVSGLANSEVMSTLNSGDYAGAATQITMYKTNGGSLSARREREKALFSKDGFPKKDMSGVDPAPENKEPPVDDATQNPVVASKPKKVVQTTGAPAQESSRSSEDKKEKRKVEGFKDPNGKYPKLFDEPDTNRLARHQKIDQTIITTKESGRAKNIVSGGNGSWSQPKIPYNAKYPFNHVRVTESGHVQEFDDTEGSERIHTYHRSGTYEEIDNNGSRVNRIIGDGFEIFERNSNVVIRGSCNITVIGNCNMRVENNWNVDVLGDINFTAGGNFNMGATGSANICSGSPTNIDAPQINLNCGRANNPKGKGSAGGLPGFGTLSSPNRNDERIQSFESPEEGDPKEHVKKLEASGAVDPEEKQPVEKKPEEKPAPTPVEKKPAVVKDCSMIPENGPIDESLQLTPNFKLSDISWGRLSRKQSVNLTKAEIACNMKQLAENCLEPIKKMYPNMKISSGYRDFVPSGGAKHSDHLFGCAADIQIPGLNKAQMFEVAQRLASSLSYTQIILEFAGGSPWIHVGYNVKKGLKMQKFTMVNHVVRSPNLSTIVPI